MVCLLVLASSGSKSDRVITTGANETTAAELPGGSTVALGARSTLNVGVTDQQWVAMLVEGEAIFEVPRDAPRPLVVETFLAKARAAAGAKFRVKIDSSVEFELFAGVVDVFPRGANGEPAKITLRKGVPYRVPVDMRGATAANRCGTVVAKLVDG
jgi:transmembrane sensor